MPHRRYHGLNLTAVLNVSAWHESYSWAARIHHHSHVQAYLRKYPDSKKVWLVHRTQSLGCHHHVTGQGNVAALFSLHVAVPTVPVQGNCSNCAWLPVLGSFATWLLLITARRVASLDLLLLVVHRFPPQTVSLCLSSSSSCLCLIGRRAFVWLNKVEQSRRHYNMHTHTDRHNTFDRSRLKPSHTLANCAYQPKMYRAHSYPQVLCALNY